MLSQRIFGSRRFAQPKHTLLSPFRLPLLRSVRLPSDITWRSQLGSSRCACWGLCCLPFPPPRGWKAVIERPYPACYKRLFLPLLSSLLIFPSPGHFGRLQFCLSSVRCSLLFFVNPLRSSIFSPSHLNSLSAGTISDLSGLTGRHLTGFFGRGSREGLETE